MIHSQLAKSFSSLVTSLGNHIAIKHVRARTILSFCSMQYDWHTWIHICDRLSSITQFSVIQLRIRFLFIHSIFFLYFIFVFFFSIFYFASGSPSTNVYLGRSLTVLIYQSGTLWLHFIQSCAGVVQQDDTNKTRKSSRSLIPLFVSKRKMRLFETDKRGFNGNVYNFDVVAETQFNLKN